MLSSDENKKLIVGSGRVIETRRIPQPSRFLTVAYHDHGNKVPADVGCSEADFTGLSFGDLARTGKLMVDDGEVIR